MGQNEKDSNAIDDEEFDEDFHENMHHPHQRNAANARERARMRVLSKAFCRLKTTLPWVPPDTKLSKLDTLRLATSYIAHLRAVLKLSENETPRPNVQPTNMSWPFNFHSNWEPQTTTKTSNMTSTKTDRHDSKFGDKKRILVEELDSEYDYPHGCKFHAPRTVRICKKQNRRFYEETQQSQHMVNTGHESNFNYYKSCAYVE